MCGGVRYVDAGGREWKVYFPNPQAALPVIRPEGVAWVKWGVRREEAVPGFVPGGWARRDSIQAGKWARFAPEPVQLAATAFMEKDEHKISHWIVVPDGMAIEGLLITKGEDARVYIVTDSTPAEYAWVHDRWPSLVEKIDLAAGRLD